MRVTLPRVVALCIAITYSVVLTVIVLLSGMSVGVLAFLPLAFLPLGLIWFPEEIGHTTDFFVCNKYVGGKTPWWFVSGAGWFFLVSMPVGIVWAWALRT